jgi:hypothetical protein
VNYSRFLKNPAARLAAEGSAPDRDFPLTSLDPARLDNLRVAWSGSGEWGWRAACPACRAAGSDKSGDHLFVWEDGRFGCTVQKTGEHRSLIFKLAGLHGLSGPRQHPLAARLERDRREREEKERAAVARVCLRVWEGIKAIGDEAEGAPASECITILLGESPCPVSSDPLAQFRVFCCIFVDAEMAWVGERDCRPGSMFRDRCFFPRDPGSLLRRWERLRQESNLSDHTLLFSMRPEAGGRAGCDFGRRAGCVVEHDGPADLRTPVRHQIALLAWLRDACGLPLWAVLATGGKGVHGWLDPVAFSAMLRIPSSPRPVSLGEFLKTVGADHQAFSRSATRCPGVARVDTGKMQKILWLDKKSEKKPLHL